MCLNYFKYVHDVLVAVAVHIEEANGQRGKLSAGDGVIRGESVAALAVGDAVVVEVLDVAGCKSLGNHEGKQECLDYQDSEQLL